MHWYSCVLEQALRAVGSGSEECYLVVRIAACQFELWLVVSGPSGGTVTGSLRSEHAFVDCHLW